MNDDTNKKLARAERAIEAAKNSAKTPNGGYRVEEVQLHYAGVVEPGYDNHDVVATGNWNTINHYDKETGKFVDDDLVMKRLAGVLEQLGVELEWSDEWSTCDECQGLFRTSADSYGWQPSYVDDDEGSRVCVNCVDPVQHLEALEGQHKRCNTIAKIDPADHGYVLVEDGFENGFHPGQDADPGVIAKALRAQGIERFVFNLDDVGQFDARFSVYVHKDEAELLDKEKYDEAEKDGPSVSGAMERGLREASLKMAELPDGHGVKYATVNADGTASVRLVSPQEFVEGIGKRQS